MKFLKTKLAGVLIVEPDVYRDPRGFFLENYHQKKYAEGGIDVKFVQDNHSRSVKNTLRGLHFQLRSPQGKLVRVVQGEIYDVAVDIRRSSPTFGQWEGLVLSAENFLQLYVPPGYAHGFAVLSDVAEVEYKCTDFYRKDDEASVLWNDEDIGINWPVREPLLSAKDAAARPMKEMMDRLPAGVS